MRGIYTSKTKIRRQIFTEIARLAYENGDIRKLDELPYKIIPGEVACYRDSVFVEREIVGERLRVALGLSLRDIKKHSLISEGVEASAIEEKYYEPPLINIIKFACNACPEKRIIVTDACQRCLEHPCTEVCPKDAVELRPHRAHIIPEKCIRCGKCVEACPYNAIVRQMRPCAHSCGVDAIGSDEYGRAEINYDRCVSCGMCLVNCPFSAIVDKGQIYQTILALKSDAPVYAMLAPSIAGQFGPDMKPEKIRPAFQALGFKDIAEVAVGADLCAIEEAEDFIREVPNNIPFMGTSCCPAWSVMAKKLYPEHENCISMTLTPMTLTARLIKQREPDCKIVFVGPCAAKKLEASRKSVRSYVDFVLTYEEVKGMFEAKEIDFKELPDGEPMKYASADGRGFAVTGGVANAVVNVIKRLDSQREVSVQKAEGLQNCRQMMKMAKAGKYNGFLLEGMACPGGCIGGAGTMEPLKKSEASLNQMKKQAVIQESLDSEFVSLLPELKVFKK